jgi:ribulose-phosphate 3-epimerase
MISPVNELAKSFADAGADLISFHPEAVEDIFETIEIIKESGCKVGIAINPDTPLSVLNNIIQEIDLVLLMSVYPGFGGQKFIEESIEKIQAVRKLIDKQDNKIFLEVDGGINDETISRVSKAGANVFVAGSAIFGSSDYEQTINSFRKNIS